MSPWCYLTKSIVVGPSEGTSALTGDWVRVVGDGRPGRGYHAATVRRDGGWWWGLNDQCWTGDRAGSKRRHGEGASGYGESPGNAP